MRRIRLFAIAFISFITITSSSFLQRVFVVSLCGIIGINAPANSLISDNVAHATLPTSGTEATKLVAQDRALATFPFGSTVGFVSNTGMQSFAWTPDDRYLAEDLRHQLAVESLESEFQTALKNGQHKKRQNSTQLVANTESQVAVAERTAISISAQKAANSTPINIESANQIAQFRIPGVNIPGIPGGGNVVKDAVLSQVAGQLGGFVESERPFSTTIKDVYPTVSAPPSGEFRPSEANRQVFNQALRNSNGSPEIKLPPGDYEIIGKVFCYKPRTYGPSTKAGYPLAPIKGKQAEALIALNSRYFGAGIPWYSAQKLSWNIQLSVKYEDMDAESRAIVDKILPEYRQQLSRSFWEDLQAKWGQVSRTIPGVPSFDSAIGKLPGEVGQTLKTYQEGRDALQQHRDNFDRLQNELVLVGNAPSDPNDDKFPRGIWSKISDRVYARVLTQGDFQAPATLQVRVLDNKGNAVQSSSSSSVSQL
jgi:hypothetical protein